MIRVSAHASGRIVELNVIKGQHIEKGQIVATIHSTELAQAQSAFLKETTASSRLTGPLHAPSNFSTRASSVPPSSSVARPRPGRWQRNSPSCESNSA